ncbi:MAG: (Fe-S)-binding protein, partial [Alistipes sp.]|nr:(Fe-S)-binding protein [Alistipes sp.]
MSNVSDEKRYDYLRGGLDRSSGAGRTGYFAGCMTLLTPRILRAMERIFAASGEEVWWADKEGGVCCGRPLKLSGETDSARRMMQYNVDLFRRHGITTLVTSCPICLKVFREEYDLEGIEVLHHSEYILRLIRSGRLSPGRDDRKFTYHDPCELGRGSGIYDQPRAVIEAVGELLEPEQTREHALCCGSSVANTVITDAQQLRLARSVAGELLATGADAIVTACPLCKKAIGRGAEGREVLDLAEVVAGALPDSR